MFGAAAGLIPPFQLGPVVFDNFTLGGWLCASLDVGIILNLTFRFTEVTQQPGSHAGDGAATDNAGSQPGGGGGGAAAVSFAGVWACIAFFFVFGLRTSAGGAPFSPLPGGGGESRRR